jgi:hypothetical protein
VRFDDFAVNACLTVLSVVRGIDAIQLDFFLKKRQAPDFRFGIVGTVMQRDIKLLHAQHFVECQPFPDIIPVVLDACRQ